MSDEGGTRASTKRNADKNGATQREREREREREKRAVEPSDVFLAIKKRKKRTKVHSGKNPINT